MDDNATPSKTHHLIWKQTLAGTDWKAFHSQQISNRMDGCSEVACKGRMFTSILQFCAQNDINPFEFLPLTFRLTTNVTHDGGSSLRFFANFFKQIESLRQIDDPVDIEDKAAIQSLVLDNPAMITNHCKYFPLMPFAIPRAFRSFQETDSQALMNALWLLKPAALSRGRGIAVFRSLQEFSDLVQLKNPVFSPKGVHRSPGQKRSIVVPQSKKKPSPDAIPCSEWVVQKYLERPMLYKSRKFDIRMWLLITPNMHAYLFREGYCRTASVKLDLQDDCPFIHLTNNFVQAKCEMYGEGESGNQVSFTDMDHYIKNTYPPRVYDKARMISTDNTLPPFLARAHQLAALALYSTRKSYNPRRSLGGCFELLGVDFMMDEDGETWLIEMNSNPCLEQPSPLLESLIPRMIDDLWTLSVDPFFPIHHASKNSLATIGDEHMALYWKFRKRLGIPSIPSNNAEDPNDGDSKAALDAFVMPSVVPLDNRDSLYFDYVCCLLQPQDHPRVLKTLKHNEDTPAQDGLFCENAACACCNLVRHRPWKSFFFQKNRIDNSCEACRQYSPTSPALGTTPIKRFTNQRLQSPNLSTASTLRTPIAAPSRSTVVSLLPSYRGLDLNNKRSNPDPRHSSPQRSRLTDNRSTISAHLGVTSRPSRGTVHGYISSSTLKSAQAGKSIKHSISSLASAKLPSKKPAASSSQQQMTPPPRNPSIRARKVGKPKVASQNTRRSSITTLPSLSQSQLSDKKKLSLRSSTTSTTVSSSAKRKKSRVARKKAPSLPKTVTPISILAAGMSATTATKSSRTCSSPLPQSALSISLSSSGSNRVKRKGSKSKASSSGKRCPRNLSVPGRTSIKKTKKKKKVKSTPGIIKNTLHHSSSLDTSVKPASKKPEKKKSHHDDDVNSLSDVNSSRNSSMPTTAMVVSPSSLSLPHRSKLLLSTPSSSTTTSSFFKRPLLEATSFLQ